MIYWDTSCVLKLYTSEPDSTVWQKLALLLEDDFVSSVILETELAYAFEQKELRREIKPGGAKALLHIFRNDLLAERFSLFPVGTDVLKTSATIAAQCYHAKKPIQMRTLDGLHLATSKLLKCKAVATADLRMQDAAALLNIPLLRP